MFSKSSAAHTVAAGWDSLGGGGARDNQLVASAGNLAFSSW